MTASGQAAAMTIAMTIRIVTSTSRRLATNGLRRTDEVGYPSQSG